MDDTQKQHHAEQAILAVTEILPANKFENWQHYERLLQSGLACAHWITNCQLETEQAAWLLNEIALYLENVKTDYTKAESLFERALTIHEKVLGEDHPNLATSLNNLACLYNAQGKYEQAPNPCINAVWRLMKKPWIKTNLALPTV
ncbi:MAG: tetratricopeptide repeat protein [Methylococcales bacterium]|nr:tetratricopeptide repeat protein [Methylococcales bacterium]